MPARFPDITDGVAPDCIVDCPYSGCGRENVADEPYTGDDAVCCCACACWFDVEIDKSGEAFGVNTAGDECEECGQGDDACLCDGEEDS